MNKEMKMKTENNDFVVLDAGVANGEPSELTELELNLILGGYEPGYNEQQNNPTGNALDLRSDPSAGQSSTIETIKNDVGTVSDFAGAGSGVGAAVDYVTGGSSGSELGNVIGTAIGIGVVIGEHWDGMVSVGNQALDYINSIEPENRGNIP